MHQSHQNHSSCWRSVSATDFRSKTHAKTTVIVMKTLSRMDVWCFNPQIAALSISFTPSNFQTELDGLFVFHVREKIASSRQIACACFSLMQRQCPFSAIMWGFQYLKS